MGWNLSMLAWYHHVNEIFGPVQALDRDKTSNAKNASPQIISAH
jgi:hypothetical protein